MKFCSHATDLFFFHIRRKVSQKLLIRVFSETTMPLYRRFVFPWFSKRAERRFFAQGHTKINSFFPSVTSLRFIALDLNFSVPIGRIICFYSWINYAGITIYHIPKSWLPNFSSASYRQEKNQVLHFLEGKGYIFQCYSNNKLRNANDVVIDSITFRRAACSDIFCQSFFSASFCQKGRKIIFFWKKIVIFLIAHCVC